MEGLGFRVEGLGFRVRGKYTSPPPQLRRPAAAGSTWHGTLLLESSSVEPEDRLRVILQALVGQTALSPKP